MFPLSNPVSQWMGSGKSIATLSQVRAVVSTEIEDDSAILSQGE